MAKKLKQQKAGGELLRNAKETAKIEKYWHLLGQAKPRKPPKEYDYVEELAHLQLELIKLQEWVRMQGLRVCVLFEGRDAAGKGGVIKRITQHCLLGGFYVDCKRNFTVPTAAQIISDLRVRYAALNLHYEAAWTDSGTHRRCLHNHFTLIDAAKCAMPKGAGWYVFAVECGAARELTDDEDQVVNKFRFG